MRSKFFSSNSFIYQFLLDFEPKWIRIGQGSTFTAISGDDIKDLKLLLPTLPEQQKIATFLSALDKKIETVGAEVGRLEEWKKGLLQQLFV
jgi:type I restriction enzyme S subunit